MDLVTKNPGLQHIGESIFMFLDHQSLLSCREVNQSFKLILDNPRFWLKKCAQIGMPNRFQELEDWTKVIQVMQENQPNITPYLIKIHEGEVLGSESPLRMASNIGDLELSLIHI